MKFFFYVFFLLLSQVSEANAGLLNILGKAFSDSNIEIVKNGYLDFDKSITVGRALDNYKFFKSTNWDEFESEQGRDIVEFNGEIDLLKVAENALNIPGLYGDGFGRPSFFDMRDKDKMKLCLNNKDNCILSTIRYVITLQFVINKNNTFEIIHISHSYNGIDIPQNINQIHELFKNRNVIPTIPAMIIYKSKDILISKTPKYDTSLEERDTINKSNSDLNIASLQNSNRIEKQNVKFVKFSDELYNKLMENENFQQADQKLNTIWGLLKRNLSKKEFDKIKKEQTEWISEGRDKIANTYINEMSIEEAFTKATNDRIRELSDILAEEPARSEYIYTSESYEGNMNIQKENSSFHAIINTISSDGRGSCEFEGTLVDQDNDGWYESETMNDGISILFMKNKAELIDFGHILCGAYGRMDGEYIIQK